MFYCDNYSLLMTYAFEKIPSQNHDHNTRSKEATNVMDTLSKTENNLMTSIRDLKDEVINLKEIIILQDDHAILANKIVKVEDKLKSYIVIIRFTKRKHCLSAFCNRKKLMPIGKEKNLPNSRFFISKNLIPMNSKILSICPELSVHCAHIWG